MNKKVFNLTDEEKYLLLESEVGEGIFFAGLKHVAIKIIASYTEDQIITSDPSQVLAIKKAKEEFREDEKNFREGEAKRIQGAIESRPVEESSSPTETQQEVIASPESAKTDVVAAKQPVIEDNQTTEGDSLEEVSAVLDKQIDDLEKMFKDY